MTKEKITPASFEQMQIESLRALGEIIKAGTLSHETSEVIDLKIRAIITGETFDNDKTTV